MTISDPLGDMLARLRNGMMVNKSSVMCPASKLRENVLDVLKDEGFIRGYTRKNIRKGIDELEVELKYFEGKPAIKEMKRISKPGRRVYSNIEDLKPVFNGLGIAIVSSSKGIMSDKQAREQKVGGEVLCTVF